MTNSKVWLPIAALFAAGLLVGCGGGGGGSTATTQPPEEPMSTPQEQQMTLINSASAGLTTAIARLDVDAPTLEQMNAIDSAITLLADALAGAPDLTPNQTATARTQLRNARQTVATARSTHGDALELAERRNKQMIAIGEAQGDLSDALEALMADDAASITAVNDVITALQGAVDAAADLTAAETMSAMDDLRDAEVSAADTELDMYEAAAMEDGATDEELLAAYEGKLAAATRLIAALMANAGSASAIADANQVIGSATTMIANLKEKIHIAAGEEANKIRLANNAVSMQVEKGILAHGLADNPPEEFVANTAAAGAAPDGMTISRGSGDAMITPFQSAADKANKPFMMGTAPDAGTGWMGKTFTRSGTTAKRPFTEMAAVYTDIEKAGSLAWTQAAFGTATEGFTVGTNGAVTITSGTSVDVANVSGILPSAPSASGESTSITVAVNTERSGSLYGVSGTYSCAGTACVVTRTAKGMISVNQDFIFTPLNYDGDATDGDQTMAKYADPDANYTHFGYWMRSTTLRDGTKEHNIEAFHGGSNTTTNLALGDATTDTVLGTAKYYGAAAGVYVKEDGAGDSLVVTDGNFTADAMLIADFGGEKIAQASKHMISGTIFGFMDGSMSLGFADLTLEKASFSAVGAIGAITSGKTSGGGTSGVWMGQFYGNAGAGTTDAFANGDAAVSDDYPTDVSGEFNGHFVNGHVAGAFGAEKDE